MVLYDFRPPSVNQNLRGKYDSRLISGNAGTTRPLAGDAWTLKLNAGWELRAAKRKGDCIVRRK